jgi:hypothetical protein
MMELGYRETKPFRKWWWAPTASLIIMMASLISNGSENNSEYGCPSLRIHNG